MNRCALLAAACLTLVAGCATNGNQTTAASEDKEYVTGSRIPVKNKNQTGVKATSDRNTIDDIMRKGSGSGGGVTGAGGG